MRSSLRRRCSTPNVRCCAKQQDISATRRCAIAARSAAMSLMPILRPICRRCSWRWMRGSSSPARRASERFAGDFFQGMMTTALDASEILTAIEVPSKKAGREWRISSSRIRRRVTPCIGAAAVVTMKNGSCGGRAGRDRRPRAGARTAARGRERRQRVRRTLTNVMAKAAAAASKQLGGDILGDIFASAEYRKAMAPVYVKRALAAAFERAS